MEGYLSGMVCAYQYASRSGLEFWPCIPMFYDSSAPEVLEKLIETACDGVAVMNYNRSDEYGRLQERSALPASTAKELCAFTSFSRRASTTLRTSTPMPAKDLRHCAVSCAA